MRLPAVVEGAWAQRRPGVDALMRARVDDFFVEEIPLVEPEGDGEHLWLLAEKRGLTTAWLAMQLARHFRVPRRDVSFAGRKDRHACTRQWFSVRLPHREGDMPPGLHGVNWLKVLRHRRKLATGALRGNRFRLQLREIQGDRGEIEARLAQLAKLGVPNYFGAQRFGRDCGNLQQAWDMLVNNAASPRRDTRSLLLSAARSWCFNRVLARRVVDGSWQRLLPGELAALAGSRSVFAVEQPDETLEQRLAQFDIHPSGPLPGRNGQQPGGECGILERAALAELAPLVEALAAAGVASGRRPLRVRADKLAWVWQDKMLVLTFELPAGAYATGVVRELVNARDASGASVQIPA